MERLHGSHDKSEKRAILRHLYRTKLFVLLRYGLENQSWVDHPFFYERCEEVEANPYRTLDLWSRGHGKSHIITRAKTIQDILYSHGDDRQPIEGQYEICTALFSHTATAAQKFIEQMMTDAAKPELVALFPDILWDSTPESKWSTTKGFVVKRQSNPTARTVAPFGLITSQPTGGRFNKILVDDGIHRDSVTSREQIRESIDAWEALEELRGPPYLEQVVGTCWAHNDLHAHIQENGRHRIPHVRRRPSTRHGRPPTEDTTVLHDQEQHVAMWKATPVKYSMQYLLNPTAGDTNQFKEADLQFYDETFDATALKAMNRYVFIDPADGQGRNSDYTAGFVVGLAEDQNVYIVGMMRDRLNLIQRANLVFDWDRRFTPRRIYYEGNNNTDQAHFELKGKQENYNIVNRITRLVRNRVSRGKMERIEGLLPWFADRRIYLPRKFQYKSVEGEVLDLTEIFCDEYRKYPRGHDDQLDALSQLADPDVALVWPKPKIRSDAYDREDQEEFQSWVTR